MLHVSKIMKRDFFLPSFETLSLFSSNEFKNTLPRSVSSLSNFVVEKMTMSKFSCKVISNFFFPIQHELACVKSFSDWIKAFKDNFVISEFLTVTDHVCLQVTSSVGPVEYLDGWPVEKIAWRWHSFFRNFETPCLVKHLCSFEMTFHLKTYL